MPVESVITKNISYASKYSAFKPYRQYKSKAQSEIPEKKKGTAVIKQSAFVGSSIGTVLAIALSGKLPSLLSKITSKEMKKDSILIDYISTIIMALGANIGGIAGGSIGVDDKKKAKKIKEGAFQIMNIAIPMTFVTAISALCKNVKALNNNPAKIIGSIVGMTSGAFVATKITNATKGKGEADRKYTIKDATANFDDVVATIKIGFKNLAQKIPVDTILPFIYVFAGSRAGSRE